MWWLATCAHANKSSSQVIVKRSKREGRLDRVQKELYKGTGCQHFRITAVHRLAACAL